MNKKHIAKKLFCMLLTFFMFCLLPRTYSAEDIASESVQSEQMEGKSEEESEFNFIKSDKCDNNFFYNDSWLLYGGILFIIISVAGIVFTLKRPKPRHRNKSKR